MISSTTNTNRRKAEGKNAMTYTTKEAMIDRIERIVKKTVKHYISDWTEYDRPKLIKCLASNERDDKELILIARDCGTYLLRVADTKEKDSAAASILEYYKEQEASAKFYNINLQTLNIKTA